MRFLISTTLCLFVWSTSVFAEGDASALGTKTVGTTFSGAPLDPSMGLIKVAFGLVFVVAAIFATAWFYRRYGGLRGATGDGLRIIGGLSVGNRERVVLLQVGEEQVLVGVTPNHIATLLVLKHPLSTDSSHNKTVEPAFANRLADAIRKRTGA